MIGARRPETGAKAIAAIALLDIYAVPRETLRALFVEHHGNGSRVAVELGLATAQPLMAAVAALGLEEWLDEVRATKNQSGRKTTHAGEVLAKITEPTKDTNWSAFAWWAAERIGGRVEANVCRGADMASSRREAQLVLLVAHGIAHNGFVALVDEWEKL
jgi:hypothetical protein